MTAELDLSRLTRLGVRIARVESDDGFVIWSFRGSPLPRVVKGLGMALLCLLAKGALVGPYQWIIGGLFAAWTVWMLAFIPVVRLSMGHRRCVLTRAALLFWFVPVGLPDRNLPAIDFTVWRSTRAARVMIGAETASGRTRLWTFPEWINLGRFREETESAAMRLAVMLRRDLKRAGQLIDDN